MTDAEFVREIAQPLTDQSGDYDALNQSGASTRTHSQSLRETETASAMISHCLPACVREVLSECDASSHRFHRVIRKSNSRTNR
jgi:hypothetical protein